MKHSLLLWRNGTEIFLDSYAEYFSFFNLKDSKIITDKMGIEVRTFQKLLDMA